MSDDWLDDDVDPVVPRNVKRGKGDDRGAAVGMALALQLVEIGLFGDGDVDFAESRKDRRHRRAMEIPESWIKTEKFFQRVFGPKYRRD